MMRCPVSCSVQVWTYSSRERRRQDGEVDRSARRSRPVELPGRDVAVDRELDEIRLRELRRPRSTMIATKRQRDLRQYGQQVRQQPPHQPRVVGFAEDFFVVRGHATASLQLAVVLGFGLGVFESGSYRTRSASESCMRPS